MTNYSPRFNRSWFFQRLTTQGISLILVLILCFSSSCRSHKESEPDYSHLPAYQADYGFVYDEEELFTPEQEAELEDMIGDFRARTTGEIAVITSSDFSGMNDALKFAEAIGNYWGIGNAETNNGLVLALSSKRRQDAIATGSGTEFILTSQVCDSINQTVIIPFLKKDMYFEGVKFGVESLIHMMSKDYEAEESILSPESSE